ncbi:MAG: cation:proton antiporter subunit C [Cyanobacteria bacterium P01_D01_bin.105]
MLEALVLATVFCGFFGIIFKNNLILKILSMDVMSTGVIAYYVLVASRTGLVTPIAHPEITSAAVDYADPVPQAVILTAIVIGFSIQALMLVGAMKLSNTHPSLNCRAIEDSYRSEAAGYDH